MVCVLEEPTVTFEKLALEGVIVSAGCTALPDTERTALAPCELATVMLPVIFSEAVGLKDTLITAFRPAANVIGVEIPLTPKSLAFTVICEMVALVFPMLVTVTF